MALVIWGMIEVLMACLVSCVIVDSVGWVGLPFSQMPLGLPTASNPKTGQGSLSLLFMCIFSEEFINNNTEKKQTEILWKRVFFF